MPDKLQFTIRVNGDTTIKDDHGNHAIHPGPNSGGPFGIAPEVTCANGVSFGTSGRSSTRTLLEYQAGRLSGTPDGKNFERHNTDMPAGALDVARAHQDLPRSLENQHVKDIHERVDNMGRLEKLARTLTNAIPSVNRLRGNGLLPSEFNRTVDLGELPSPLQTACNAVKKATEPSR